MSKRVIFPSNVRSMYLYYTMFDNVQPSTVVIWAWVWSRKLVFNLDFHWIQPALSSYYRKNITYLKISRNCTIESVIFLTTYIISSFSDNFGPV